MSRSATRTDAINGEQLTVAQLIGSFDGGGAQRTAMNLAQAVAGAGCRSIAVAVRSPGAFAATQSTVSTYSLSEGAKIAAAHAAIRLRSLVAAQRIDVLHIHGSSCLLLAAAATIGRKFPRLYFTWHDSGSVLEGSPTKRWATRWALDRCTGVFGSSRGVASRLESAWGGRKPVSVFYNGVPESRQRFGERPNGPVLLWMARIVPDKDPEILIRAAATLRKEGLRFRLVVAGSPLERHRWFFDQITRLVTDLDLADTVLLPGWVSDTETLISSADIGVQTSHTEGLSMTLLEQMMGGLAIVATDVGETRFALDDGRCGIVIPSRDPDALISALRRMIQDTTTREAFATAARRRAIDSFSLTSMASQAMRTYTAAVEQ